MNIFLWYLCLLTLQPITLFWKLVWIKYGNLKKQFIIKTLLLFNSNVLKMFLLNWKLLFTKNIYSLFSTRLVSMGWQCQTFSLCLKWECLDVVYTPIEINSEVLKRRVFFLITSKHIDSCHHIDKTNNTVNV